MRSGTHHPQQRVLVCVRLVMGPAGVVGAQRDLSTRGEVGWAEHRGGGELSAHDGRGTVVPGHAVPYEGRYLLLLHGMVGDYDRLRLPLPAGDQGPANRAGREAMGAPLVLEEVHC